MINNDITSISYTNKDFQKIYPELLEIAGRISERWKPESSNESDPGVVLLKLCAIIADKNNYNIDKNILECFPSSVTQISNARKLFKQLGYNMKWKRSAEGEISVVFNKRKLDFTPKDTVFEIPRFETITGYDGKIVYTIAPYKSTSVSVNGEASVLSVIQGIPKDYNDGAVITASDLDINRRLYFPTNNIAENGIFITSVDATEKDILDYEDWKISNNLALESFGQKRYMFDVSADGTSCYIEFPEDIDDVIGNGIRIKYVVTDGKAGNIPYGYLYKFSNNVKVTLKDDKDAYQKVTLDVSTIGITNANGMLNGEEYESIDEAFKNYKKTVGTFDTLVTCRDYTNAVSMAKDIVSNGFVCDRTNDVSRGYNIVSQNGDIIVRENQTRVSSGSEDMSPFDLTIYATKVAFPSNDEQYNKSFEIEADVSSVKSYIATKKSIQHNFIEPETGDICMIINNYDIKCKIIPQYRLTPDNVKEIKENIKDSLRTSLDASNVDFGEEISFDRVYNIIRNADDRIKAVVLDDIVYAPYAIVKGANGYSSVACNDSSIKGDIYARCILNGNTPLYKLDKSFEYGIGYDNFSSISDDNTVKTEFALPINTATTLEDNESVIIYEKSYIYGMQYATGIRYCSNVKAGKNQIEKGSIYLFWKDSNDDTEYSYIKFTNDDGKKEWQSFADINPNDSFNTLAGVLTDTSGTTYGKKIGTDDASIWITNNIKTSLSNTQYVQKISANEASIPDTNMSFFILNNSTYNTETGKWEWVLMNAGENYKYLESGEYFITCDQNYESIQKFGAGTKIERANGETSGEKIFIDEYEKDIYASIMENGISAIKDRMKRFDESLIAKEQMITVLGKGVNVTFHTSHGDTLNNTPRALGNDEVSWIDGDEAIKKTGNDVYARSMLSLVCSNDNPMKLSNGRDYIKFGNGSPITNMFVQTNIPVSYVGSDAISKKYVENNEIKYVTFAVYSKKTDGDNIVYGKKDNTATIKLKKSSATTGKSVAISSPIADKQILSLTPSKDAEITITATTGNTVKALGYDSTSDIDTSNIEVKAGKRLYVYMSLGANATVTITNNKNEDVELVVSEIEKISNTYEEILALAPVLLKIQNLDPNHLFDYMYEPTAEELIENPVDGASFINVNHPYNKYTICKINTASSKIDVFEKGVR